MAESYFNTVRAATRTQQACEASLQSVHAGYAHRQCHRLQIAMSIRLELLRVALKQRTIGTTYLHCLFSRFPSVTFGISVLECTHGFKFHVQIHVQITAELDDIMQIMFATKSGSISGLNDKSAPVCKFSSAVPSRLEPSHCPGAGTADSSP